MPLHRVEMEVTERDLQRTWKLIAQDDADVFHEQIRSPTIDVGCPISHFHFPPVQWLHLPVHECLIPFLHLLICLSINIQNHDQGSNISRDFRFPSASLKSCLRNCRQQMQQCLGSKDIVSHKRNSHLPAGDHHTTVWKQKAANRNRHRVGSNVSNPINIHVSSTQ